MSTVQHGRFTITYPEPELMRPRPPEVWSHLVAFVRARLGERHAHPDVLWRALDRFTELLAVCHNPHASAPGESDVDVEEAVWHLASIWQNHPAFRALLEREYDRLYFDHGRRYRQPPPDRDEWVREWTP